MKAAQINEYGGPDKVEVTDVSKPSVKENQVLVEVEAASLNPFDTMVREGYVQQAISGLPITLGGDIAGTIVEIGSQVNNLAVGDKIYGQANVVAGNSGALAEFAATVAGQVTKAPANVASKTAAALPLVGVSALQAITEHINLQPGQKILIHGGAGGIGSVAAQIAKHIGAYVAVTVAPGDVEYVKSLGVDEIIDYTTQKFQDVVHDYDAVFNTADGELLNESFQVLKRGGVAVSMTGSADEALAAKYGVTALVQGTHVTTEALDKLSQLVADSIVTVRVDSVFSLGQIQEAFRRRESGAKGKVVITIK